MANIDIEKWSREQHQDLVEAHSHEIANELWKNDITADNIYITRWLEECWGFSRMTASKLRRRVKTINPLYLLAREAPEEHEIDDD